MKAEPLVSVIIPTFNREKLLPKAIGSVVSQTHKDWELIVVDDRSTDNTKKLVCDYSAKDGRIKYVCNDRSKGPAGARNCGIMHSRGKYIAFLDSDDEWFGQHLNDCVEVLENEEVKVCFSLWFESHSGKVTKVDETEDGRKRFEEAMARLKPRIKNNWIFFGDNFFEYTLLEYFYCYHINTMVFHREICSTSGLFNEKLKSNEDNDFLFRVFCDYNFCLIRDYHFVYNETPDGLYSFIDRSNMDLETVCSTPALVEKLTVNGAYKNKMRKLRKGYVRRSHKVKNKEACLKEIDRSIGEKYFTLGYINRNLSKRKALYYYIKSLFYGCSKERLIFIGKILFPFYFEKLDVSCPALDFW